MFADPAGQVVGTDLVVAMVLVFVASVTGGSICMSLAKARVEVIPKGKINAANISPLAALATVRSCVTEFLIRIPLVYICLS
jgi:hypothetical protein